ncbi:MAG: DNA-directed RNA polymerase subunit omega [Candidatus Nanopelagicales bacterium]|jgi:DNA-directed RNA polymerase subunit omega
MSVRPEGITHPSIDDLLTKTDSKYSLVSYAAKRARQINAYYAQLGEGLLEYIGPLVETHAQEKPLSIALREIDAGLLTSEPIELDSPVASGSTDNGLTIEVVED